VEVPNASSGVVGWVSVDCPELLELFELLELPEPLELFEPLEPLEPLPELPLDEPLPEEDLLDDPLEEDPLPDDPLFEEPLPELPLPLEPLPDEPEPDEELCDPDWELLVVVAGGARYITERTSSSIRRRTARASCARSTSAWPAVEYRQ